MTLSEALSTAWRRFRDIFWPDRRQHLIEILRDQYVKAANDVAQFQEHARRMAYPSFRDRLSRIAAEEKTHVDWLRDKIRALGGSIPETQLTVKNGRNSWACLLIDAEAKKRGYATVPERIYNLAEQANPEIAQGLRRIHEEEQRHHAEILEMLMKSDPQANLVGNFLGGGSSANH